MPDAAGPPAFLERPSGERLAYRRLPGRAPGVMFLGGFRSDMRGNKATALARHCRETGRAFVRFDYTGHGESDGRFEEGTIGRWADDAVAVLDGATEGPQVLVGSSMGGWVMLLAALARPGRVGGLVGVAAAPDFTEDLIRAQLGEAERERLEREGVILLPAEGDEPPCPLTRRLLDEGREHLLLRGPVPLSCPVRLLHGLRDADVPWKVSLRLLEVLDGADATLTLVKAGDHRLSAPADIARLTATVEALCRRVEAAPA